MGYKAGPLGAFYDFIANYFPKHLKIADRLKATFSRSISSGVASTVNDFVRRPQLAAASLAPLSMIPPVPDPHRPSNAQAQQRCISMHM